MSDTIQYIDAGRIYPHPENPRKDVGDVTELAESIKAQGILQNLTVIPWAEMHGEAAPELAAFKEMFSQVQADIDRLQYSFGKVRSAQPEAAEKLAGAIAALAEKLKGW